jgi:ribA/ribD-fused uncharacterized protein
MGIVINSFKGEHSIYSNFYPVIVQFEGLNFPTVEHAYQASKSKEHFFRKLMASLPAKAAGLAKRRGSIIRLRSDWKDVQIDIMHELLCQKFKQEPFRTKLLETEDAIIIEGNYWHDNNWGDCGCKDCKDISGENWLGRLIMDIRSQIIEKDNCYRRYS